MRVYILETDVYQVPQRANLIVHRSLMRRKKYSSSSSDLFRDKYIPHTTAHLPDCHPRSIWTNHALQGLESKPIVTFNTSSPSFVVFIRVFASYVTRLKRKKCLFHPVMLEPTTSNFSRDAPRGVFMTDSLCFLILRITQRNRCRRSIA